MVNINRLVICAALAVSIVGCSKGIDCDSPEVTDFVLDSIFSGLEPTQRLAYVNPEIVDIQVVKEDGQSGMLTCKGMYRQLGSKTGDPEAISEVEYFVDPKADIEEAGSMGVNRPDLVFQKALRAANR